MDWVEDPDGNEIAKEDVFIYLDDLRESGVTNMFGAGQYIEATFGLRRKMAGDLLVEWMQTFEERHSL